MGAVADDLPATVPEGSTSRETMSRGAFSKRHLPDDVAVSWQTPDEARSKLSM
jgi:hypothetical protein